MCSKCIRGINMSMSTWICYFSPTICAVCRCTNGECAPNAKGERLCQCPPGFAHYYYFECRECNCGEGKNCTFGDYVKVKNERFKEQICICKEGFEGTGITCAGGTCALNEKGEDICECPPGFSLYMGNKCKGM
ncbi:delta-like protein C [Stegodyphus dumicola]|uniref:delta-like protein C n=1 Tax=Stegodyphus dumicola TaxID=202533 RepID=UPI0015AD8F5D|nr:delta-like protein C [Stegodyphus dumicola]